MAKRADILAATFAPGRRGPTAIYREFVDREQAREQARILLDRWVKAAEHQADIVSGLTGPDLEPVEMVGALDHPRAGEFLAAVAGGPVSKELRKGARRGLHRLRASGRTAPAVQVAPTRPALQLSVEYRLAEARASAPDGIGSRWLWLFVERSTGGGYLFAMILNEIVGVKNVMVSDITHKRYLERLQDTTRGSGIDFHELPTDYARALIAESLQLNQASGFSVPAELQTHQALLGDFGEPPERALIYDMVSAAEVRLEPAYLEQSPEIADEPEVEHWLFDFHQVRPFAEQARQMGSSLVVVGEAGQRERLERIETEAIRTIFTDEARRGFKRRLEETAYIFWVTGRERAARLAVASAIALERPIVSSSIIVRVDQGPSRVQHPLIRELLERSIDMANELERSGMADRVPHRSPHDPME